MYSIIFHIAHIQELGRGRKIQSASLGKFIKNSEVFNNLHSRTIDLKSCVKKLRTSKKSYSKIQTTLNTDYWSPKIIKYE